MNVVLANIDYQTHTTDEGDQFQRGLAHAGWMLSGAGYDNQRRVSNIVEQYRPESVVVHDKRDWDPASGICFRQGISFVGLEVLARLGGVYKTCVIKDAGSSIQYHENFAREINANALITYYHDISVTTQAPWMKAYEKIRTYHSVDTDVALRAFKVERKRATVTGAVSNTYPLRQRVFNNARLLGCDVLKHPGYGNKMSHTTNYLNHLGQYKVHVATASAYGFALRKIIESVAVGAIPVTDLPEYDVLPEIDEALVRVKSDIPLEELRWVIEKAAASWDVDQRRKLAEKAIEFYNWRKIGDRLSSLLKSHAATKK